MRQAISWLVLTTLLAGACHAQPSPPDAPVRLTGSAAEAARASAPFRMFSAWLDAMGSPDPAKLREFSERHCPPGTKDSYLRLRDNSGGLELRALDEATATNVAGVVQEHSSDNFLRFNLTLEPDDPDRVKFIEILYIPRPADFPPPRMTDAEIFAALDAKLTEDAAADRFSGVVLVERRGKVLYRAARGLADRERNLPNTFDTRFNLGSMNKMFTGVAIMQLVQSGRIALADPLGKFLPDYPNQEIATKVTIEHLLTHTGGTGNIFGPEYDAHRLELQTHADYVKVYGARGPSFEPGSRYEYSNYGMVLLGLVIERVTGKTYYEYVARHVFKPARMKRTGSEPIDALWPNTAIGYMRAKEGGRKPNLEVLTRGTSGGGGYSTVGDLAKFADALMSNKLLNAASTRAVITGKVDMPGGGRYAYGFQDLVERDGYVGHGGAAPGVNSDLKIFPKSGYTVVVMTNIDPPFAGRLASWLTLRLNNQK